MAENVYPLALISGCSFEGSTIITATHNGSNSLKNTDTCNRKLILILFSLFHWDNRKLILIISNSYTSYNSNSYNNFMRSLKELRNSQHAFIKGVHFCQSPAFLEVRSFPPQVSVKWHATVKCWFHLSLYKFNAVGKLLVMLHFEFQSWRNWFENYKVSLLFLQQWKLQF